MSLSRPPLIFKQLGIQDYEDTWQAMKTFTENRSAETPDEIWFVEHNPVFTQGQAGKPEHILSVDDIPVVQVDRGGQVTYHGHGQQVVYFLIDLKRRKIGVRALVTAIENIVVNLLAKYGIEAHAKPDAPGVYVFDRKICSLGLKIKRGCSYHGLALNVNMDLEPFAQINPCGYAGLEITQIASLGGPTRLSDIEDDFKESILNSLSKQ